MRFISGIPSLPLLKTSVITDGKQMLSPALHRGKFSAVDKNHKRVSMHETSNISVHSQFLNSLRTISAIHGHNGNSQTEDV